MTGTTAVVAHTGDNIGTDHEVPEQNTGGRRRRTDQVLLTRVGLRIPKNLSFDDWERAGHQLAGIVDSSAWSLGDWLVYGADHYADRYQRVLKTVGLSYKTLRNYSWVSRRFPLERRRSGLSFQHHAELASLPDEEQEKWLTRSEEGGWSTKQLRAQVRAEQRALESGDRPGELVPRIDVQGSRLRRWQEAAARSGTRLSDWLPAILDQAAEQVLLADAEPGGPAVAVDESELVIVGIHVARVDTD
ncbi:LmbU family transcriptional regulator [Saccharothrix syringae]|uniref:LmbU family transcriptional regulator n=1 Tax=Saccharothrix syringae TaxID=103733 RepID=UPI000AA373FE|nr:LmbU family transcriptional regulator [Saccharothrix syringae]